MFPPDQDGIGKKSIKRAVRGFEGERLDTKLADIEGIQLLKKLEETAPEMRRVIVTGYPTLENVIQALNLGADAYPVKPVKPEEILETVRRQLAERDRKSKDRYALIENSKKKHNNPRGPLIHKD